MIELLFNKCYKKLSSKNILIDLITNLIKVIFMEDGDKLIIKEIGKTIGLMIIKWGK